MLRGKTYLIDWKKSGKQQTSLATTYDAPIQVAAYIGTINAFNEYSFKVTNLLEVIYKDIQIVLCKLCNCTNR